MLNLLAKDFKLIFAKKDNLKSQILSLVFTVAVLALLVAIETFVFQSVLNTIKNYENAPFAFLTLFLFILSIIMSIFGVMQAKKLFFNPLDMEQLSVHPVSNSQIITSKLIFLFCIHYISELLFTYPLFLSYGMTFYKATSFYYITLFYPLLAFFFEIGIALIFVYPIKRLLDWLKKHLVLQFIVSIVGIFGLAYLYSKVLSIFISLVASNQLATIFTSERMATLNKMSQYFIPTKFLTQIFIHNSGVTLLPYLCIAIGVFSLGLTICIISFKTFKNSMRSTSHLKKEHMIKIKSQTIGLIKKELILIFKDSNYIFSFSGLLVVQPFLAYMVISALNTIFKSGTFGYYLLALPNFIPLIDVLLLMLFTLIISSGANSYIAMENKNVRLMKTIPVSVYKQLAIKVLIPFTFSMISLFVTILTLLIGSEISLKTAFFAFLLVSILLAIFDLVSLFEEMKIKRNKPRNSFVSSLYSYLLPIVYFVVTIILSYFNVSIYLVYLLGLVVLLLASLPYVISLKRRINQLFIELEMVN